MNLDLDELIKAEIIDVSIADKIRDYYTKRKNPNASTRLIQIVSLIGVSLIGLGLILIVGYNWDQIPKVWRIIISFIPLISAQGIGTYTLLQDKSKVWKESSALAILFGIAIAMALITQIYFLDVNLLEFLKLWILLSIPLIYIFDSAIVSLGVWSMIGSYLTRTTWSADYSRLFLPLSMMAVAVVPYARKLIAKASNQGWAWHHWVIPIVLTIFLFSLNPYSSSRMTMIYLIITCIGMDTLRQYYIDEKGILNNGYKVLSFLGIWIIAFMMTFNFFGKEVLNKTLFQSFYEHPTWLIPLVFAVLLLFLIWLRVTKKVSAGTSEIWWIGFILIPFILFGGGAPDLFRWLASALVLIGSARMIYRGIQHEELPILNIGILILASWIICRFFEYDISFLWRGIIFIALGILCFSLNYVLIKRCKA